MTVMKFGGSSMESPEAVRRVCAIVQSRAHLHPVVVVSAVGQTTNPLLSVAEQASRGHGYQARRTLRQIEDEHFRLADDLVCGKKLDNLERSIQKQFRELHGLVHDLAEDGRELVPSLRDYIASFGERLSSEIVAGALLQLHVPTVHLDSREFIVTNDRFGSAEPLLWDTFARLRRAIPCIADKDVVVMGGFIGATAEGITTTLGRGGSDLTASLVGAGIDAEEIQIWTDVDGMLTCDPRVIDGALRVKSLSYDEATAMACAGAKVLHPGAVAPAVRQRIPLSIRNSRNAGVDGTRITACCAESRSGVKCIAARQNLLLLEIASSEGAGQDALLWKIEEICRKKRVDPALLATVGTTVVLGLDDVAAAEMLSLELSGCLEVHLRQHAALITLVGGGMEPRRDEVGRRVRESLKRTAHRILPGKEGSLAMWILVDQSDCKRTCERLHREFFGECEEQLFCAIAPVKPETTTPSPVDLALAYARRRHSLMHLYLAR